MDGLELSLSNARAFSDRGGDQVQAGDQGTEPRPASPTVSVILTAFRRTRFLASALKSIVDQTFDPARMELVLVTNLEQFSTNEKLARHADLGTLNVRILFPGQIPRGPSCALGISSSSGVPSRIPR